MFSFQLKLEGEILRTAFNRLEPASGDVIVQDAVAALERMIDAGEIVGGEKLLIDGAQSIAVSYALAHRLGHLYQVVAIHDPKLGSKIYTATGAFRRKSYIVCIAHCSTWKAGDIIETEEQCEQRSTIKVVLCGPPRSGKSCLREGLKQAILGTLGAPYPYVITACPDGEGSWFQQTYQQDQELAEENKRQTKSELTADFASQAAQWVKSANQLINIIDIGGKVSPENKKIVEHASHAILLSGDPNAFEEWEIFCRQFNLKVIAKINSDSKGEKDQVYLAKDWRLNTSQILENSPILTGSVHKLERGADLLHRPMIKELANVLIHLTKC
jgi:CRISPR-associated protein Csx3